MNDPVNHPQHYEAERRYIAVEPIDLCENFDFCLGNALKYILRAPHKGHHDEDLKKAEWYLRRYLSNKDCPRPTNGWRLSMALNGFGNHPALITAKERINRELKRPTCTELDGDTVHGHCPIFALGLLDWVTAELANATTATEPISA